MAAIPFLSLSFILFIVICILCLLFLACHVNILYSVFVDLHNKIFQLKKNVFQKHTTKTLRGNTLPCALVSTFTRIQAVLGGGGVGNCTLMCVSASSRVTVPTVTGLKYSSLGSAQGGDGLSITLCTFLGCC